jgi:hypothetical protein
VPELCHDGTPFFPPPQIKPSSSHSLSSSPSDNIPCAPSGHEVEIHDELHPHNQKTHFHTGLNLPRFLFGLSDVFETQCKEWVFVSTS